MDTQEKLQSLQSWQTSPVYEAPRVEAVLTAEELEREVLYAGQTPV